ncbi:MAG: hypothetical protein M3Q85_09835 [Acidobacteriota bacterium]|nr:hypothetical protein [Acidobacteriota bacterium]
MDTHAVNTDVPALARLQQRALIVGVLGLAAGAVGAVLNPDQFFRSWLIGFLFCLGLSLGPLALLMLQHMSGGQWGLVGRRVFEAASRNLPFVALLFIPILFGLPRLFEWARPEAVQADHILQIKAPYLNVPFFIARAVLYFVLWIGGAWLLNKWSAAQDRGEIATTPADSRRFRVVSAPGLIVYVLTLTFASTDWVMSLDAHWYSTIFGFIFVAGQGLTGFALVIVVLSALTDTEPYATFLNKRHFLDLGKLLLAFVMLWAYFSFSQFLIIWSGNLPEEITFFTERLEGGWQWVSLAILLGHFALPFVLLLSRDLKRRPRLLAQVALVILVFRFVDLMWLVEPMFGHEGFPLHWMNLAVPAGLTGVWLFLFARQLRSRPLLPLNDPFFKEAFAHDVH